MVVLLMITGCSQQPMIPPVTNEENTGLKDYVLYRIMPRENIYNTIRGNIYPLSYEDEDKLNAITSNYYPYHFLGRTTAPWEGQIVIHREDEVIADMQEFMHRTEGTFVYNILPYFSENTISSYIVNRFTGELEEGLLPIYISQNLLNRFDIQIPNGFDEKYIVDYWISCPIDDNGKTRYEFIDVKAQVMGVINSNTGHGESYAKYEYIVNIMKQYSPKLHRTDAYIVVSDNEADLKKIKEESFSCPVKLEEREW